jgi:hypothetical protein
MLPWRLDVRARALNVLRQSARGQQRETCTLEKQPVNRPRHCVAAFGRGRDTSLEVISQTYSALSVLSVALSVLSVLSVAYALSRTSRTFFSISSLEKGFARKSPALTSEPG